MLVDASSSYAIEQHDGAVVLRLISSDGTNRLSRALVSQLIEAVHHLGKNPRPLVITGNERFFSAGAELAEIAALSGAEAYRFSQPGQALMTAIENFPATVCAAIYGYCMGGGLDLALACRHRIASPDAIFGHRGAALGLITAWGGTQRLPRLVGKAKALEMLVAAEKIHAAEALRIGLVDKMAADPVSMAMDMTPVLTR